MSEAALESLTLAAATRRLSVIRGTVSEDALRLAYHAAIPVVVDAGLLNLLRVNFFLDDPPDVLPFETEAELLLSPLFREVGEGLYEIEPSVRNVLLARLYDRYGSTRVHRVAALLGQYTDANAVWQSLPELELAQQLTVMSFLDPTGAQRWLDVQEAARPLSLVADGPTREWYIAMRRRVAENSAVAWLAAHTEEPAAPVRSRAGAGYPAPPRDEWSFREFYMSRRARMIGLIRAITAGKVSDPELVAEEGWIRFFPHWEDCKHPDAFVRQCMISAANDALRQAAYEPRTSSLDGEPALAQVVADSAPSHLSADPTDRPWDPELTRALQRLSPRLREFVLLDIELNLHERRSLAEIAAILGISRAAAYSRRNRAYKELLRLLPENYLELRAAQHALNTEHPERIETQLRNAIAELI